MTRKRALITGWVLVLALSATLPASALFHGVFHAGSKPLVVHGTLTRPVIALGSDVVLLRGSRSIVVALFGNIYVHSTASDDLVSVAGTTYLERGAHVKADVLSILGGVYRAPEVRVDGRLGGAVHAWTGTSTPSSRDPSALLATNIRLGLAAGLALLLIGSCLAVVFPWQVVLVASTLRSSPVKSVAAGVMNALILVFLVVPLGLSLAGLPFAVLLAGAAALAWLFGLTGAAVVVGRAMSRGTVPLLWATAAGLVVMALSLAVPVIGPLTITAVGLAGAGALAVALISRSRPATPMP